MKIIKNEHGFIVSVTAIIIAVILGLLVMYFSNSIALNVTSSANNYSSSQARWSAISGIEDIIIKLNTTGIYYVAGTYSFYNGDIIIDTTTIDPINQVMQITSRGMHSSSNRIFSLNIKPSENDTVISETFDNGDSLSYGPSGPGPGPRYWGLSCDGAAPPFLPNYVLNGADSCFFFGSKIQNNSFLMPGIAGTDDEPEYVLSLSLAAGVDVANVVNQSKFQTGDFIEFYVNNILIERWEGTSGGGGQPLTPRVGNSTENMTPNFEDYEFNITQIIGIAPTMLIRFEANTNADAKYIGIEGLSLFGTGGWDVLDGGYIEI